MALIGKGEKDKGIRVCDIAFQHFHSKHITLLLLVKVYDSTRPRSSFTFFFFQAVVLFMAGKHVNAMSRMDDLITDGIGSWVDPTLYVVQAREIYPHVRSRHY